MNIHQLITLRTAAAAAACCLALGACQQEAATEEETTRETTLAIELDEATRAAISNEQTFRLVYSANTTNFTTSNGWLAYQWNSGQTYLKQINANDAGTYTSDATNTFGWDNVTLHLALVTPAIAPVAINNAANPNGYGYQLERGAQTISTLQLGSYYFQRVYAWRVSTGSPNVYSNVLPVSGELKQNIAKLTVEFRMGPATSGTAKLAKAQVTNLYHNVWFRPKSPTYYDNWAFPTTLENTTEATEQTIPAYVDGDKYVLCTGEYIFPLPYLTREWTNTIVTGYAKQTFTRPKVHYEFSELLDADGQLMKGDFEIALDMEPMKHYKVTLTVGTTNIKVHAQWVDWAEGNDTAGGANQWKDSPTILIGTIPLYQSAATPDGDWEDKTPGGISVTD